MSESTAEAVDFCFEQGRQACLKGRAKKQKP
jgi:hypothetical protein